MTRLTRSAVAARIRTTRSKAASSKPDNPKEGITKAASSVATGSKRKREDDVDAVSTQWRKGDKQPGFQVLLPSPPARKRPRLPWYALYPADQERFDKETLPLTLLVMSLAKPRGRGLPAMALRNLLPRRNQRVILRRILRMALVKILRKTLRRILRMAPRRILRRTQALMTPMKILTRKMAERRRGLMLGRPTPENQPPRIVMSMTRKATTM